MTTSEARPRLSIFDAAREAPGQLALIDGLTALSFEALAERVARRLGELDRARCLDQAGERPVAVVATPGLATLETLLALLHAGTPVLPLHPRLTEAERRALIGTTGAVDEPPAESKEERRTPPPASSDSERIAALVPTSGSTGAPRLARLSHRALAAAADASARHLGVEDNDRTLLALPLAHVGGLMVPIRALVARRAVVLFDPGASLLGRLDALGAELRARAVTQLSLVPAVLDRLLAPELAFSPAPELRALLVGGAGTPHELHLRAHERGIPVLTTYGLTEACSQVATRRYAERFAAPTPGGSVGVPLSSVAVRAVGGVLEVRGPTLFSGYAGDPTSDPGTDWYRTGDLGSVTDEGEVSVTGRATDLIVTGGENVDPLEVEAVLASLPGVAAACVVALPDATFGQTVAALFVRRTPGTPAARELFAGISARLARHKCPRRLLAVDGLPLLPTGKVDRRRAADLHRSALLALPAFGVSRPL